MSSDEAQEGTEMTATTYARTATTTTDTTITSNAVADAASAQHTVTASAITANVAKAAPPVVIPSAHRRALLTWLAVYPTITLANELVGKSVAHYPLPVRTLVVTLLVVPIVSYLIVPRLAKVNTRLTLAWRSRRAEAARRDAERGLAAQINSLAN